MITPSFKIPGSGGVPSSQALATIMGYNLASRITRYNHSIVDRGGFESARIDTTMRDPDEAVSWAEYLGAHVAMINDDAVVIWEGRFTGIETSYGGRKRSISLDGMANRIIVRYTDANSSTFVLAAANNTTSQRRYGVKTRILSSSEITSTGATNERTQALAELSYPAFRSQTAIGGDAPATGTTALLFTGWYYTLDDLVTSNTTKTTAVTTTQVTTLLTAYAAVNAWLSTDYAQIVASGISETQYLAEETTYRNAIESRLIQGNGTNPYAWGIYEGRRFRAGVYAKATPTAISYYGSVGQRAIWASPIVQTQLSMVRPNAMYAERDFGDLTIATTQGDSYGRHYVGRVVYDWSPDSGEGLSLEPSDVDSVDARLAVIGG